MPLSYRIVKVSKPAGVAEASSCTTLRLESDLLAIDILPELGGKIYHWRYKPLNRDFLWQNPQLTPAPLPYRTPYNENWCGGWDDLFPSCLPIHHAGRHYPDHGEYWTQPIEWDVSTEGDRLVVYLSAQGPFSSARLERWLTLEAGSPVVRIRYRISYTGDAPLEFLWSLHPAFSVSPRCRLVIPAGAGVIAAPGLGRLAGTPTTFTWPHVPAADGSNIDFSRIPQPGGIPDYEMVYLTELRAGWIAMLDDSLHAGFGISFDQTLFNNIWIFATYGGWQGLNTVVVEPATTWPTDLAKAARAGRARTLLPGQSLDTEIAAVVFTGRDTVNEIAPNGVVN